MRVIIHNFDDFDISHINHLAEALKELELKENTLSVLEIKYPKQTLRYSVYHNKKSLTVTSHWFDNKER